MQFKVFLGFMTAVAFSVLSFQALSQDQTSSQVQNNSQVQDSSQDQSSVLDQNSAPASKPAQSPRPSAKNTFKKSSPAPLHSFRPLLIQGGKKLRRNTKNIKVDVNSISETEVFFIEPNFKKRIYLDEGEL